MNRREFMLLAGGAAARIALPAVAADNKAAESWDVCVYGGTASGVVAAVAAAREGCRMILVEPGRWLGGMTGGGLVHIDWGRPGAFGGMTTKLLKDGTTDPQYRRLFEELLKSHSIPVIHEHRAASTQREGATIQPCPRG